MSSPQFKSCDRIMYLQLAWNNKRTGRDEAMV